MSQGVGVVAPQPFGKTPSATVTAIDRKGFIITVLGYPSEDGAAAQPGSWFPRPPVNLGLQQRLYQVTLTTIAQEPWLRGLFWFWWANPPNPN